MNTIKNHNKHNYNEVPKQKNEEAQVEVESAKVALEATTYIPEQQKETMEASTYIPDTNEVEQPKVTQPPVDQPKKELAKVTAHKLNLRVSPGLKSKVLKVLVKGDVLEIKGRDKEWLNISVADGGLSGWVMLKFVEAI